MPHFAPVPVCCRSPRPARPSPHIQQQQSFTSEAGARARARAPPRSAAQGPRSIARSTGLTRPPPAAKPARFAAYRGDPQHR